MRWIVTPVRESPAISARSTGAAPRQRGRSDGCTFSHSARERSDVRDQQPVRGDDDGVGRDVDVLVETWRLLHRNAEPFGNFLRRRRRELAAAAARLVRTRQQQRDVVLLRKPLEHVGAERRGGRDGDAGHYVRTMRGRRMPSASRRASGVVRSIISTPSRWSVSCCTHRAA